MPPFFPKFGKKPAKNIYYHFRKNIWNIFKPIKLFQTVSSIVRTINNSIMYLILIVLLLLSVGVFLSLVAGVAEWLPSAVVLILRLPSAPAFFFFGSDSLPIIII